MDEKLREIGERLRGMRDILGLSCAEMAAATGVSEVEYREIESGHRDVSFTFLYRAAGRLNLDLTELLTGEAPRRRGYTLVRKGQGLPISRRAGFSYLNLAPYFLGRIAEPFEVQAPYAPGQETVAIQLNSHAGQEFDLIFSGQLRVQIGNAEEILQAGDAIYYDSGIPHGMVAVGGTPCTFLAVVIQPQQEEHGGAV